MKFYIIRAINLIWFIYLWWIYHEKNLQAINLPYNEFTKNPPHSKEIQNWSLTTLVLCPRHFKIKLADLDKTLIRLTLQVKMANIYFDWYILQTFSGVIRNNVYTYLPNPSAWERYDTRSIFKWSLTGLNSEFSFS